jgi:3-deoxy-D-manno-octulosonic-acid transferase
MGTFILIVLNVFFVPFALGYFLFFLLSSRRTLLKTIFAELKERCGFSKSDGVLKTRKETPVWIHCASVGEAKSIKGIVTKLREKLPNKPIVITTSTVAGKKVAKDLKIDQAILAPLDFYPFVKRFIKTFSPSHLFVVEKELWPNMFVCAKNNGVKTVLINATISDRSKKRYQKISPLLKTMFSHVESACVQTEKDKEKYEDLGLNANKIHVSGNIKYDLLSENPPKTDDVKKTIDTLDWNDSKILVCGSTHLHEEKIFCKVFSKLKKRYPDFKLVLAPRHIERIFETKKELERYSLNYVLLGDDDIVVAKQNADCLLIDSMGWVNAFYANSYTNFVGGTLEKKGGHNLLEAAIIKKPLIFGKYTYNLPHVAKALIDNNAALEVSEDNLEETIAKLINDSKLVEDMGLNAQNTAKGFQGATNKTLDIMLKSF